MNFILRLPKFPVLLDAGDSLVLARSRSQFEAKVSKLTFADNTKRDIIDANAEGFSLYAEKMFVTPNISAHRWTKIRIIELYNSRRKPGTPELRSTSLGNRSLEKIVSEAVELLSRN
jgi:hypothetical protein